MNRKTRNRYLLSLDQQKNIVELIQEQNHHNVTREQFTESVLMVFEDVPGFEMVSDSESQSIINQLWSLYHGKSI